MRTADIPAAMRLKESAGWNQTEQDWANVLALEPESCWLEEQGGEIVASTVAVCYGQGRAADLASSPATHLAPSPAARPAPSPVPDRAPSPGPHLPPSLAPDLAPSPAPHLARSLAPDLAPSRAPRLVPVPDVAPGPAPDPAAGMARDLARDVAPGLAWIGMVLVDPRFRGRGFARGLMEHCLRWLEARGVLQVKLDATAMGRPLYEKLGFREERIIERWRGPASEGKAGKAGLPASDLPLPAIASLDRASFGVDRRRLIEQLLKAFPGHGVWEPEGFVLGRPGSHSYFLGPCAAADAPAAERLIRCFLERTSAPSFYWDLFPDQPAVVDLARDTGFERQRELVRMALRPEAGLPGHPERVFAVAGFEYG